MTSETISAPESLPPPVSRYTAAPSGWHAAYFFILLWVFALILLVGFAAGFLLTVRRQLGVDPRHDPALLALALLLLAAFVIWIILLRRFQRQRRYLEIRPEGVRFNLPGVGLASWPWEQITGIRLVLIEPRFLGLRGRQRWQAWLDHSSGRSARLDSELPNLPEALTRLKAALYPRLHRSLRRDLQAGKPLRFGPLTVAPAQFSIHRRFHRRVNLPWQQVRALSTQGGRLVIQRQKDRPLRLPVQFIPNLELLLEVIKQDIHP